MAKEKESLISSMLLVIGHRKKYHSIMLLSESTESLGMKVVHKNEFARWDSS